MKAKFSVILLLMIAAIPAAPSFAQNTANPANLPQRDGSHDFDFLIGNWKAHVRRLPDRLNNSNVWVEYEGIPITRNSSTATRISRSLKSPVPTKSFISRPRRFASTTQFHINGAFFLL